MKSCSRKVLQLETMENNKFYIVSEGALDEFVCFKCYNYLTVTPIGVINREFVCGRCPQENMDINPHMDGQDFSKKLFRCINRFDGCRKLLRYSEVKKHEEECLSKANVCYCFRCSFSGNLCQIYNHVKRQHSDSISNSVSFLFNTSKGLEIIRFLRYKDYLTLIITKIKAKRLFLKVINYGKENKKNPLNYQIILRNLEENVLYEFPRKICDVVNEIKYTFTEGDDSIGLVEFRKFCRQGILRCEIKFIEQFSSLCLIDFPDLTSSSTSKAKPEEVLGSKEELKKKNASDTEGSSSPHLELIDSSTQTEESDISNSERCGKWYERRSRRNMSTRGRRNMLVPTETKKGKFLDSIRDTFFKCSNCEIFVCNANYLCQLNHIKCEECVSDFCSKCNEISNYKPVTDGRDLLLTEVELPCRFNEMHLYASESLRKHEYSCPDRQFFCPLLCGWQGKLNDLWQHWHSTTAPLLGNTCEVDSFRKGNSVFYVLYEPDCFCCQILEDKYRKDQKYIHIRHSWALCSNVSKSCAVVKLKIFSNEEYSFETVSCKIFKLGEIKAIKVPLNTYYRIKIEFESSEPEGLTYM